VSSGGASSTGGTSSTDGGSGDATDGAQSGPYACAGATLPNTAPATILVSGTAVTPSDVGVGGVEITAFAKAGTQLAQTVTSTGGAVGTFSLSVPTSGSPLDAYLRARISGKVDSYLFFAVPLAKNTSNVKVLSYTASERDALYFFGGVSATGGTGTVIATIRDCTNAPVLGATFSLTPGAAAVVKYGVSGRPSSTATMTSADGAAYGFNASPGNAQANAFISSGSFRGVPVIVFGGAVTEVTIAP
jgi:hypothetical protein